MKILYLCYGYIWYIYLKLYNANKRMKLIRSHVVAYCEHIYPTKAKRCPTCRPMWRYTCFSACRLDHWLRFVVVPAKWEYDGSKLIAIYNGCQCCHCQWKQFVGTLTYQHTHTHTHKRCHPDNATMSIQHLHTTNLGWLYRRIDHPFSTNK